MVGNPKDRASHDMAHVIVVLKNKLLTYLQAKLYKIVYEHTKIRRPVDRN